MQISTKFDDKGVKSDSGGAIGSSNFAVGFCYKTDLETVADLKERITTKRPLCSKQKYHYVRLLVLNGQDNLTPLCWKTAVEAWSNPEFNEALLLAVMRSPAVEKPSIFMAGSLRPIDNFVSPSELQSPWLNFDWKGPFGYFHLGNVNSNFKNPVQFAIGETKSRSVKADNVDFRSSVEVAFDSRLGLSGGRSGGENPILSQE